MSYQYLEPSYKEQNFILLTSSHVKNTDYTTKQCGLCIELLRMMYMIKTHQELDRSYRQFQMFKYDTGGLFP